MVAPTSLAPTLPDDRPLLGIDFMLAAGLLFVMLDTGVKWHGQSCWSDCWAPAAS